MKEVILKVIFPLMAILILFLAYKSGELYRTYRKEVQRALKRTYDIKKEVLTEKDMQKLPDPVKKYLHYVGAVGKEKVNSVKVVMKGKMILDTKRDWVKIQAEQYNVMDAKPTRMFHIKAMMFGIIPIIGLHTYNDKEGRMLIKLAGMITVVDSKGPEARISDTTTLLNDMCILAPAMLIDERIEWEEVDALTARATFENLGVKVSASLYFNEEGALINFVSEDRYYAPLDGSTRKARWSTPVGGYKKMNDHLLPAYGEAIWNFPEGDLCYAKFDLIEVLYNCRE